MATLLLYQSLHGTTRKVAMIIASSWYHDSIQMVDLAQEKVPDLNPFDTVLVGGSIHSGKIQKKVGQFCEALIEQLLTKKVGLFMCFLDAEQGMIEFEQNFPFALREHALAHGLFGGGLKLEKMGFWVKREGRKAIKDMEALAELNLQAVEDFIQQMKTHQITKNV